MIQITNEDNMELMSRYPDNHFDLAIVDPPYGIGENGGKSRARKKWNCYDKPKHAEKQWDNEIPNPEYFKELKRVSNHFIIWGGNYFIDELNRCENVVAWDKCCDKSDFSDFEIALTSFKKANKIFRLPIQAESQRRIHPTQKPVKLYEWLLMNYAKPNQKILDTHLGSGSIALAVHNCNEREQMNLSLTACELDKEYYEAAMQRLNNHTQQTTIFSI